ncbi:unnamed protein product [Rhizoctonia solani]|uniref:Uncharacterized protein n=1 Tax=Rhizoctonia solani TaxID=456999 RepID=A0A8H3GRU1_9AGAM|nr:unnamed protein product [Rhizoctonia solani]
MRSIILGLLGYVSSSLLPFTMALDTLLPNHAVADLYVVQANFTVMTPRDTKSMLDRQLFDFGSPYHNGFSGLGRFAKRQGCSAGFGVCPNDPTTCCQINGDCCGGGSCCKAGSFCYGGGCCDSNKVGCDNKGCCDRGADCCLGGGCCASGSRCVIINGKPGCCPSGETCVSEPQCTRTGYSLCANEDFCCPTGNVCYRDPTTNEPMCRDPNAQTSTSVASVPSSSPVTTSALVTPSSSSTSIIVTTEQVTTSTSPQQATPTSAPSPDPTTTRIVVTQTSVLTQTHQSSAEVPPLPHSSTRSVAETIVTGTSHTAQASGTEAVLVPQSQLNTNMGAIAGGTVAGVVALVVILISLIIWRRRQSDKSDESEIPAGDLGGGPSHNHAYSPGAVPPTSGTVDPFLTPMNQHPNLGASYFGGTEAGSPRGTGYTPHYTGLPEPQHGDNMGSAIATSVMPVPRHDVHRPYPLPMSVTPMREAVADTRPWSGFGSRHLEGQNGAYGGGETPYQAPRGWSNYEIANTNSAYSNTPGPSNAYDFTPPARAPSTEYQPSSEASGSHLPPASPPPGGLYPRAISGNMSSLPGGAAPPVTNFVPAEKPLY